MKAGWGKMAMPEGSGKKNIREEQRIGAGNGFSLKPGTGRIRKQEKKGCIIRIPLLFGVLSIMPYVSPESAGGHPVIPSDIPFCCTFAGERVRYSHRSGTAGSVIRM